LSLDGDNDEGANSGEADVELDEEADNELNDDRNQGFGVNASSNDNLQAEEELHNDIDEDIGVDVEVHVDHPKERNLNVNDGRNDGINVGLDLRKERRQHSNSDLRVVAGILDQVDVRANINSGNDINQAAGPGRASVAASNNIPNGYTNGIGTDADRVIDWSRGSSGEKAEGKDGGENGSEAHCEGVWKRV